jgi:hypothetical protein
VPGVNFSHGKKIFISSYDLKGHAAPRKFGRFSTTIVPASML